MRILVLVSNDLSTDQRVERVCRTLSNQGHHVELFGRLLPNSLPLAQLPYKTKRFKLPFQAGPLFYISLNLTLFFRLLLKPCDVIHANDLDTLLPAFLLAKICRKKLVYDTHEYFTGVPELQKRPKVRRIWEALEGFMFPKLSHIFTVNDSIARLYTEKYGSSNIRVMRNIPPQFEVSAAPLPEGIPADSFKIILQGNGINVDRGGEEAVEMMRYLDGAVLIIAGSGDVIPQLKARVETMGLQSKVIFLPRMPYAKLMGITASCDLGLSLDKDSNINYRFSLPNKLFDYLRAGIPVFATPLPEVSRIVTDYQTGWLCDSLNPEAMAKQIDRIRNNPSEYMHLRNQLSNASALLSWETECKALIELYQSFGKA